MDNTVTTKRITVNIILIMRLIIMVNIILIMKLIPFASKNLVKQVEVNFSWLGCSYWNMSTWIRVYSARKRSHFCLPMALFGSLRKVLLSDWWLVLIRCERKAPLIGWSRTDLVNLHICRSNFIGVYVY